MLFSVEQAFVGRDERRAPLKTPVWEARTEPAQENSRYFATTLLVSLRNDVWGTSAEIPFWWQVTTQIWVVLLIANFSRGTTNQKYYPDMGSDTSSVRNFCSRSTDVILRGNQWWRHDLFPLATTEQLGNIYVIFDIRVSAGTHMESGPLCLCLQQDRLCGRQAVSNVCDAPPISGTLRSNYADGNENVKKSIGFISKTTTLHVHHTCLYVSFSVVARLPRENA